MSDAALTHGAHAPASTRLQHHFDTMAQQKEAVTLGMWVFLVTEIMFFGGMFAAYLIYRMWYYQGFVAASHELDLAAGRHQHRGADRQLAHRRAGRPRGADRQEAGRR